MISLDVAVVEKAIGVPVCRWCGNCYAIAVAVVDTVVTGGDAVYGHYRGPVAPDGDWGARCHDPFIQHGWIKMEDGTIVDPTRWCFTNEEPEITIIDLDDPRQEEYDEGGNTFRSAMRQPCPEVREGDKFVGVKLPSSTSIFVNLMLPHGVTHELLTFAQLAWVANTPYDQLGSHAGPLYDALDEINSVGLVPWDNLQQAMRDVPSRTS